MPTFGPRVIDAAEFAASAAADKLATSRFGSRVVDVPDPPVLDPQTDGPALDDGVSYSLIELKKLLAENTAHYDDIYKAEFARPDGPRPDALREFLAVEMAKADGPDPDHLDAIEKALG